MSTIKHKRVEADIQKALSEVLRTDLKNRKNLEFASITDVSLTNDLSYLTVYVHFADASDEQQTNYLEDLAKKASAIRTALAKRVSLRKMPELIFKIDESFANANRIEELLKQVKSEDNE